MREACITSYKATNEDQLRLSKEYRETSRSASSGTGSSAVTLVRCDLRQSTQQMNASRTCDLASL